MVSFLVTYYNQEKYVTRSLDSVFSQRLDEDFEILVGDDGSSDNTCKIINEYSLRYPGKIKLFIQSRDSNIDYSAVERASYNRLNLLRNAKGDYVCFLDGDDEYCDFTWIQESINILKNNKKLIGVAHNYKETYENNVEKIPTGICGYEYISAKLYCKKLYTPAGTILFRRIINDESYNNLITLKSFDDNDITFYFLNFGDLYCVNKIVYNYHQNIGSIWNSTNNLEKSLINAIDYEILKKIIKKYHIFLLLKYFNSLSYCYRNRKLLSETRYEKYKTQCIKNQLMDILLNWEKTKRFVKIKTSLTIYYYFLLVVIIKIINNCGKIFKRDGR